MESVNQIVSKTPDFSKFDLFNLHTQTGALPGEGPDILHSRVCQRSVHYYKHSHNLNLNIEP